VRSVSYSFIASSSRVAQQGSLVLVQPQTEQGSQITHILEQQGAHCHCSGHLWGHWKGWWWVMHVMVPIMTDHI